MLERCKNIVVFFSDFVTQNGTGSEDCGALNDSCGTLYYVSMQINNLSTSIVDIFVTNGQNEEQIIEYQQSSNLPYNPCLLSPIVHLQIFSII